ncbi:MAG TPA: DUF1015 domain-containing protein [Solirubrobacterales bacterium]|jgi:uncharacterized protein (DUF1015 family)|nr:DUF1015 domain-containing protein [Solirubrobacterales bacterium]
MADVRPIYATHYDLDVVGSLQDVAAPPYDVIDAAMRAELLERSPYNAVAIDLPKPYGEAGPKDTGDDPYARAAQAMGDWRAAGALVTDSEPAIWAMTQDYTGPDGTPRTRHGILARVRVEDFSAGQVLPHERTLPGPKKDRLDLTRATRHNLSPIFSLSTKDPWPPVAAAIDPDAPWGEARDEGGTATKVWRVGEVEIHRQVTELLAGAQLLIADGHHRYETAIAYRDEVGGDGDHNYTLMALTGLDDPGLTVFPTHRLLAGFRDDPARQQRLGEGLRELFETTEVPLEQLDPLGEEGAGVFGLYDAHHQRAFRLRLKDEAVADLDRQLAGKPEAYCRLDAAILETLVLKGIAGLSEDDVLAKRGLGYAKSVEDSLSLIEQGAYDVAFILRPIPVDQVRAICESEENMPPKSTYFFPKVLTGLVFNPVG